MLGRPGIDGSPGMLLRESVLGRSGTSAGAANTDRDVELASVAMMKEELGVSFMIAYDGVVW